MSASVVGLLEWKKRTDNDGHRSYLAKWLVKTTDVDDGPSIAESAPELPQVGNSWAVGNDVDLWAMCWPDWITEPVVQGEPNDLWTVEQQFSTRPLKRCQDTPVEDPLMEPARIGGTWVTMQREAVFNRFGNRLENSSYEQLRGSKVEFDDARPTVNIGLNVSVLDLPLYTQLIHCVNDSPMWGVAERCVKLSSISWQRVLFGSCSYFYTVDFGFDVNWDTFDRDLLDIGTRILAPGADVTNPSNFIQYKDRNGEPAECILDGFGSPWRGGVGGQLLLRNDDTSGTIQFTTPNHGLQKNDLFKIVWEDGFRHSCKVTQVVGSNPANVDFEGGVGDVLPIVGTVMSTGTYGILHIEKYFEANLFLLGIPVSLG